VTAGTDQICLAKVEGKLYAIGNLCTHLRCPLARGSLEKYVLTCPCHGSQFDVRTGKVVHPPATAPEPTYEVKVEGTIVLLRASCAASKVGLPLG
ncbi:MAG TPA: Rieske (2Fe-2S) protein, partial [Candidatus Binatus sp.]|nr:Rieske (2Fe-2S) protein [Candidatus Binatus sp.]